ncbi:MULTISPECIES: cytochrome o ubiquinol oxidase subunit IV [unclassified Sulfitobacter]|uniref:cytochrome o ubiquinol oxidase subunit IV n=1 Tax=unclassified Sulfitobacter TaxID=196795 RepID=UPI0007C34160|nr:MULTISPECIES: cytochrome C oxidase subunit IV family protein [unclassified Sulfitobacter]KZY04984.1 cytochrome-c oxidase [Sulfitobacter sp. HI0023]KZY23537.1 cytochrome-c oxidase [Sulfitobacter sp. HI0040]KZZ68371.1 cytochrome-c oxidase [Sulfitobacter sp. HI0129]
MNDDRFPDSELPGHGRELRHYLTGAAVTLTLTLAAFGIVWLSVLPRYWTLGVVSVLAVLQIVAHFRYFLHIDLGKSHRDDLLMILFTSLIIVMMVGGTIWILFNQFARMM